MTEPVPNVEDDSDQPSGWNDLDWAALLYAIRNKRCTPFLGAGAAAGVLPLGGNIAAEWAEEYGYPFSDTNNLVRVAQFLAVETGSPFMPKEWIKEKFDSIGPPDFSNPAEPHRVAAELRLPVYITTNYDDFMMQAIKYVDAQALAKDQTFKAREPRQALCKWHRTNLTEQEMDLGFEPTEETPVIFHMHGYLREPGSMVLTEDDYLDFLTSVSRVEGVIPPRIERAFTESSLLFLGYSLEDINFKVLFQNLMRYLPRSQADRHVSVQLRPKSKTPTNEEIDRAEKQRLYMEKNFGLKKVKLYWGTCHKFTRELVEVTERLSKKKKNE